MAKEINVSVEQIDLTSSRGTARSHTVTIDRPESKEGTDQGAMGGELLLVSLGGCFMSNLLELVRTRNADISNLRADITGVLEDAPKRYSAINMRISGTTDDMAQLEKFVTMAERACLVANTLKQAVTLSISVSETEAQP